MKIADGELRQLLTYDIKLAPDVVRELVADSRQSGHTLLQTAVGSKVVSEQQIAKAQAKRLQIPYVDLSERTILQKTLISIPHAIAAKYQVICFDTTATSIKVAMADPRSERARKALKDYSGKTIRRYLATGSDLAKAMRGYRNRADAPLHLSTGELVTTLLEQAVTNGSRDIHFELHGDDLLVKRRAGKQSQTVSTLPASKLRAIVSWCKLQAGIDVGDTEHAHHGQFTLHLNNAVTKVLVTTLPVIDGETLTLRLIASSQSIPSLANIGFDSKDVAQLQKTIADGRGLIVVAGGHGSDLPATLASIAQLATKQPHSSVATIEDPLHYHLDGSTQTEVTTNLSFADALDASLTQNPTTLVVNQFGDGKTTEQLVDYALSQHLVIGSLYATSLSKILVDFTKRLSTPALIAAGLRLIIMQRAIAKICPICRIEFTPTGPLKKALSEQFTLAEQHTLYRQGKGCKSCNKGINGTVMSYEWLHVTPELQQLLATKADGQAIDGFLQTHTTYRRQLGRLASAGVISIDEATQQAA